MSPALPVVALLGAGSMGGAIAEGLAAAGADVRVTTRGAARSASYAARGIRSAAVEDDADANRAAVRDAGVVVLGVKPYAIAELLAGIADALPRDALVVSVAAGVTTATMEALVPNVVVRAMPNTPALVGLGVTGVAAGSRADAGAVELATAVFATVGRVLVVSEDRIDALSTVSGSGPAYVFLLIEELTRTAVGLGFDEADARLMVEGTFRGAAELLAASEEDPAELRRRVTSPNGTTERAIAVLAEADLAGLFDRATAAALARARELAAG